MTGIQVNINSMLTTMNIPGCMMIHELQVATSQDSHVQQLKVTNHQRMAREQRSHSTKSQIILDVSR